MDKHLHMIGEDDLGKYLVVTMDTCIYPLTAVMKSTYWFTDRCFVFLNWDNPTLKTLSVYFRMKAEESDNKALMQIAGEFLNSVLDQIIREKLDEDTKELKSIIVKRAFSEAISKKEKEFLKNL